MTKFLSKIITKTGHICFKIARLISQKPELNLWIKHQGDKTHRLNYDLNEHSLVFDIGGYEGQWANDIFSK